MKMPAVQSTGTILVSAAVLFATCLAGPVDAQESSTPARLALFPSDVVSPGTLQLQAGTSYANTSADETLRIGGMVLRYGVGPVELQAEPGSYVVRRGGEPYRGLEDLTFGMKTTLFRSAGGMVQVSGQGTLTVPTGAAEVTSGDPNITLSTMADLAIADGLFFSTSLDWLSPHFAGDENWTVGLFPAMAVPFFSGGAALGWSGHLEDGSLDSTLLAALFVELNRGTALEMSAGRSLEKRDVFIGVRVFRLLYSK